MTVSLENMFTPEELEKIKKEKEENTKLSIELDWDLFWKGDINTLNSVIIHESLILLKHLAPSVTLTEKQLKAKIKEERDYKKNLYEICKRKVEELENQISKESKEVVRLYHEYNGGFEEIDKIFEEIDKIDPIMSWQVLDYAHLLIKLKSAKYQLMINDIYN